MDSALRPVLLETVGKNGLQLLCVLQIGIGPACDKGLVDSAAVPEIHREIGQQNVFPTPVEPQIRPAAGSVVLHDPLEHLMADDLDVLLGGEKHSREYHAQYRGHQNHAHGHEFDLQFSDHGRIAPFLSKTLWKSGKMWTLWKTTPPQALPGSSPPCGSCGSSPGSGDGPASSAGRRCRPPHCCPLRRTHSPRPSAAASPW